MQRQVSGCVFGWCKLSTVITEILRGKNADRFAGLGSEKNDP
jgi:hypothetical protein